ncbi:MAG: hypothetical protein RR356_04960 [Bacteroidales bacterium]
MKIIIYRLVGILLLLFFNTIITDVSAEDTCCVKNISTVKNFCQAATNDYHFLTNFPFSFDATLITSFHFQSVTSSSHYVFHLLRSMTGFTRNISQLTGVKYNPPAIYVENQSNRHYLYRIHKLQI